MANLVEDLTMVITPTAGNTFGTAVSATGGLTAVNLINCGSNRINAQVTSTAVAGAGTADIKIQESSDNSTWVDVTGATFTQITAANALQMISFNTMRQYVRGYATIGGTSVTLQLVFFVPNKNAPLNTPSWINESGPTAS